MKNILVPIDFSIASHAASEYAAGLARAFDAKVILINAIVPPVAIDDVAAASLLMSEAELIEGNKNLMSKVEERISKKYAVKIETIIREAFPPDFILDMAASKHADVIVMGMKGKGQSNSIFGSTTTTIIRKSSFPVFVIPENAVYTSMNTITFATDFDADLQIKNYSLLQELAEKYNSSIQIINVQKSEYAMTSEDVVGKMKTDLTFSQSRHSFYTSADNNVERGIRTFLEKNPSDILAMVAHKHTFFERAFGKIHTKKMSYQTKIPLLVLQDR